MSALTDNQNICVTHYHAATTSGLGALIDYFIKLVYHFKALPQEIADASSASTMSLLPW
jgi:hypothetical protein